MLTTEGIKYIRNFIGESTVRVGFYNYMSKQEINNIERGLINNPRARKILTDYLINKFNSIDISENEIAVRGKLALAGYNCGTEKSKKVIDMLEG